MHTIVALPDNDAINACDDHTATMERNLLEDNERA
jgi:hypothetical protein